MNNDRVNTPNPSEPLTPKKKKKISERSIKERMAMVKMTTQQRAVGCVTCAYGEQCEQLPPCSTCYFTTHDPDSTDNWVRKEKEEEEG